MALDELEHARLARDVSQFAGAPAQVVLDPAMLVFEASTDVVESIAVLIVPSLCLGEILAVRLTHELRANARVPAAQGALDRVLADEPRHAALGWETLDWLLSLPRADTTRRWLEMRLPGWVASIQDSFVAARAETHLRQLADEDLVWGLVHPARQEAIVAETLERDWRPRLARRGFTIDCPTPDGVFSTLE